MRFASLILLAVAVVGCAKPPTAPPPRAETIRAETRAAAIDIGQAVTDGKAWIAKAHTALRAEIARIELTEPAPALRGVSDDLTRAETALEPVGPATQAIVKLADEAKAETDKEAAAKEKKAKELKEERSQFFSYQQRVMFYSALAILAVVIGVMMLLRAFGGAVVAEVVSDILRAVWAGIKAVVLFPFWIIDKLNDKYEAKEGEKK
jgi:hypothetical protein